MIAGRDFVNSEQYGLYIYQELYIISGTPVVDIYIWKDCLVDICIWKDCLVDICIWKDCLIVSN